MSVRWRHWARQGCRQGGAQGTGSSPPSTQLSPASSALPTRKCLDGEMEGGTGTLPRLRAGPVQQAQCAAPTFCHLRADCVCCLRSGGASPSVPRTAPLEPLSGLMVMPRWPAPASHRGPALDALPGLRGRGEPLGEGEGRGLRGTWLPVLSGPHFTGRSLSCDLSPTSHSTTQSWGAPCRAPRRSFFLTQSPAWS